MSDSEEEQEEEHMDSMPEDDSMLQNNDPDTLRILLSTDNHLGYAERDTVRGMDSFSAFEEVLYLARRFHCDMVLIAGDLFHENRPSRRTLHKTMEILRRYCMGPDPVAIQILSADTSKLFRSSSSGVANYLDPNYAVHLPVFSIHGNHDDPSRDQGGGELLAALDLLAVSNLVNYFGRQDEVDQIEISPILLQKGRTQLALYGLGSLRDERLNRMWERQKVRFLRPQVEDDDANDDQGFFNIFALHQNRDLGRGAKNCVQETMIPEWMDVVVWGHEHECLIEFFESVVGTFRITQPGSSVATSLVPGEAARKKVGILDIKGKNFRLHPVPLTQVRSFVMTELSLREHRMNLDPEDPKIDAKVTKVLEDEVQLLVRGARENTKEVLQEARAAGSDAGDVGSAIKYKLQRPEEVLVRVRVDHGGFSSLNNQRFGAKFVGEVANPNDILLFHRKKDPKLASTVKKQGIKPIAPEELERTNMEDLVREQLVAVPEGKLQLLGEKDLSEALEEYVDKSMTAAIPDVAVDLLDKTQKTLIKGKQGEELIVKESQILDVLDRETASKELAQEKRSQSSRSAARTNAIPANDSFANENGMDDEDYIDEVPHADAIENPASRTALSRAHTSSSIEESHEPAQKATARGARSITVDRPKRGATKRKVAYALEESDDEEFVSDEIVDSDNDDEIEVAPPSKRKGPAPRSRAKSKAAPTRKAATSTRKNAARVPTRMNQADSDDDSLDNTQYKGGTMDLDDDWGSAIPKTARSQR